MDNASTIDAVIANRDGLFHGAQDVLPLGEELEQRVRVYARTVSRSERQRLWELEHEYAVGLWTAEEHRKRLDRWEARCAAERALRGACGASDRDHQIAEEQR